MDNVSGGPQALAPHDWRIYAKRLELVERQKAALLEALVILERAHAHIVEDAEQEIFDEDCAKARAAIRAAKGETK